MGEKDDFFRHRNEIEPSKRRILKEQPSGTDYLDEQFFPGIEKYERRNEATENETEAGNRLNLENTDDSQQDYFSHQYFNKRKQDPRDFQRRPRDENFQLNEENDNQSRGPEFERRKSMFKAEPSENDEFKGQKRVFNKKNDSRGFVRRPRTENFESYEKEEQEKSAEKSGELEK
ncbi:unnamed protein product [Caenorhabditis auriculariae]|uniref:Uncharacterized protein n=1 Tax=Caenorhabditis auriculariae TaxID=2777116 RepID=A0A8S1HWF8_9PELO|nr:unnamed protein product [Caenorhabditis auriculariae]